MWRSTEPQSSSRAITDTLHPHIIKLRTRFIGRPKPATIPNDSKACVTMNGAVMPCHEMTQPRDLSRSTVEASLTRRTVQRQPSQLWVHPGPIRLPHKIRMRLHHRPGLCMEMVLAITRTLQVYWKVRVLVLGRTASHKPWPKVQIFTVNGLFIQQVSISSIRYEYPITYTVRYGTRIC